MHNTALLPYCIYFELLKIEKTKKGIRRTRDGPIKGYIFKNCRNVDYVFKMFFP